ncbi:GP63 leishmanolysin [Leptomonas pyrrhocoris]|uniref:Leishmanolysin n=1 Tax=Leptomonas pyrrhocoris TaxID=157538 RepID=A0A0N0DSQ8_LEPPY|nr:GP63 leishmanolysin [Leptomonas pyrrhocoris]XP_015654394.1 GP63 leishmanolysin [Leptomonas pyrrhocoris]KPA75954.1 GP63 leishmanolysin [Leptomonas pyrrhocoris]KPA75955.1 GP63 leishmanolysin [Leptomonas pyrrhocoris]|eukprot:XP_015654393.1 GP63 leishmanolysin [Leptomonas pyrrhocoris]
MPSPSPSRTGNGHPRRPHRTTARAVRLAAGVLLVALLFAALAALSAEDAHGHLQHVCIHDKLQQRVFDSVARRRIAPHLLSRVGLPYVSAVTPVTASVQAATGGVHYALAGSSAPDVTRATEWGELRVTVSADDLTTAGHHCSAVGEVIDNHNGRNVTCTAADVVTDEKRDILMNYLIPQALQLHRERLQVRQVRGTWKVTNMDGSICGGFVVPAAHVTAGVRDTDFVLYVTSVPSEGGVLAWATVCQVFSDDQPAVGVINIPAANIAERYDQYTIHVVAHEIAHSLGFTAKLFNKTGISDFVPGIRGKDYAAPVINGTTVVAKTREQYNCSSATYMEVEDLDGPGSAGSHWKMRNAPDELMAGVAGTGYYTALTMAAFEDLGFYKANFSMAETMEWGRNAGCSFLNGKCVIDNVTQFPSMFCDQNEQLFRCHTARMSLGSCALQDYYSPLPSYFQYFTAPSVAGLSPYYDYCPFIMPWTVGSCTQSAATATPFVSAFNTFSPSSRCIDGDFTPKNNTSRFISAYLGMCTNVACNPANQTYSVQVYGSDTYIACTPGTAIELDNVSDAFEAGGYVTCPPYIEVCQSNVQAARDYESMVDGGSSSSTLHPTPVQDSSSSSPFSPPSTPRPEAASSSSSSSSSDGIHVIPFTGDAANDRLSARTAAVGLLALAVAAVCV